MYIRKAEKRDLSRIAEILVFVKRMNYRSIFRDDEFSFNLLQVMDIAREYAGLLDEIWVYDDGIVKGLIHIRGEEIKSLYVDHFFQNEGIGGRLIEFAKENFPVHYLWAIEKNTGSLRFYQAHGFSFSGERRYQDGTDVYLVKMVI